MSEVDVNMLALQNADFSQLSNEMNNMEKDIQTLLNISYFLLGAVSAIGSVIGYKLVSGCLRKKKVVKVKEDEIRLLGDIDDKLNAIAVAVKVNV